MAIASEVLNSDNTLVYGRRKKKLHSHLFLVYN